MNDCIAVTLCGVPSTSNPSKVKIQLETNCGVHIDGIRITDDAAEVQLKKRNLDKFKQRLPMFINFGNNEHVVSISPDFNAKDYSETDETSTTKFKQDSEDYQCVCDTVYNWCDLESLPTQTQGILVQGINPIITPFIIKTYFENSEISHGSTVARIILMTDGVLVLFKDDSVAKRVWDFRPHRIEGNFVTIFLKAVPKSQEDRLFLEAGEIRKTKTQVEQLLQHHAQQRNIYASIVLYPSRVFVLETKRNVSWEELQNTAEYLGYANFTTKYLPKTDCLRIECIDDLSDIELQVFLENKWLTKGGTISRIDRVDGNAVLVYFTSFKDAAAVCEKFRNDGLELHGNKLKVFPYFHCLYDNHYNVTEKNIVSQLIGKKGWPQKVSFRYETDAAIFDFLTQERACLEELEKALLDALRQKYSCLKLSLEDQHIVVKMLADQPLFMSMDMQQRCKRVCSRFLEGYDAKQINGEVSWSKEKGLKISITKQGGCITIAGRKFDVAHAMKVTYLQVDEFTRRCIEECGALSLDTKDNSIQWDRKQKLIGCKGDPLKSTNELKVLLQKFGTQIFKHEDSFVLKYLTDMCQNNKVHEDIRLLHKKFKTAMSVNLEGEILITGTKTSLSDADNALRNILDGKCLEFDFLPDNFSTIGGSNLIGEMQDNGSIKCVKEKNRIKIAGLRANVSNAENILESKLSNALIREKNWKVGSGHSIFLIKFCESFRQLCGKHSVSYKLNSSEDGILLKGTESQLKEVETGLDGLRAAISTSSKTYERYGIHEFFKSNEAKSILSCGMQFRTAISLEEKDLREVKFESASASVAKQKSTSSFASGANDLNDCEFNFGSITVNIIKGDITEQSSHAIMNSVGAGFDLKKGFVSRRILEKGGQFLQEFVDKSGGDLIKVTDAGGLSCKKIIHVLCNKTMAIEERVVSVLKKAEEEKYPSLSIPAIGTGNLEFTIAECAKFTRRGFLLFNMSQTNKPKHILENVNVVLFYDNDLKIFINEMKRLASLDVATLHFHFDNIAEAKQVRKKAKKLIAEAYVKEDFKENVIPYLDEVAFDTLINKISESDVLWTHNTHQKHILSLYGYTVAVEKALKDVKESIENISKRQATHAEKKWVWANKTEPIKHNITLILENLHGKPDKGDYVFHTGGDVYRVSFATMTLNDLQIKRTSKGVKTATSSQWMAA